MDPVFYDGYQDIIRILLSAPLLYFAIVAGIRMSGKRSTSQMNNFDWIVTVAIGSLAASGIILEDITIAESLAGIWGLLAIQWLVTKTILKSDAASDIFKSEPTLLVDRGEYLHEAMRRERVTEAEIQSAIRHNGLTDISAVQWVILETDATFSVIATRDGEFKTSIIEGVRGYSANAPV